MLDIKRIREDYEGVKARVEFRGKGDFGIENVKKFDEERRAPVSYTHLRAHET